MAGPRKGSLKSETRTLTARRLRFWRSALLYLISRRSYEGGDNDLILTAFRRYIALTRNKKCYLERKLLIETSSFEHVFLHIGDEQCLKHFRFMRSDLLRIVDVITAGPDPYSTRRNIYRSTRLFAACVVLKRLSTPQRWIEMEVMFRKHTPQLSKIFWEALDSFVERLSHLQTGPISRRYTGDRVATLATKVKNKIGALDNCIGYIDGTVIEIARPDDMGLQRVVYNGHKRKHALKFQAITTADGMFYHVYGPVGRRHDWTLYSRSGLDQQLEEVIMVEDKQYCVYGDSGYNSRVYLEIPFQGASLNADQKAFNQAMSAARITVEWMFKEVKTYWTTVDFPRKMRVLQLPVGSLYVAAILLSNIRNCFYRNQTSLYFQCTPPSLEELLAWREE